MAYEIIVDDITSDTWRELAKQFADYSIYQTWEYQHIRGQMDTQEVIPFMIKNDTGRIVTMGQVRIKRLKALALTVGYIQNGPLVYDIDGGLNCSCEALRLLRDTFVGKRVDVLRVLPNIVADQRGQQVTDVLCESGYKLIRSVKPYHTISVSLVESEEEIRRRFSRSGRRDVKIAEKAKAEIRESANMESFEILDDLYAGAMSRKGFQGLDPKSFRQTQRLLADDEKMTTIVTYLQGEPLAASVNSYLGDTFVNLYVATNKRGLKHKISYLVWFTSFVSAKHAGMKKCDVGGIDPVRNPKVYDFKKRLGGEEVFHIGAFDACSSTRARVTWRILDRFYHLLIK